MFKTGFLLFSGLLSAIAGVSAQDALSCDELIVKIVNQTDVDFYSTCPKLNFMFFIDHNFTGPFEMPGTKSLGRFSSGYLLPKLKGSDRVDDGVTSVSMPDLENTTDTTSGMLFGYLNKLTSISFPKLNTISGDLAIVDSYGVTNLTLPALSNVTGGIYLHGNFDEIDLPALKTVSYIDVFSTGDINCTALGAKFSALTFTPKEYDAGVGFTCSTPYENNSFNSSDPAQNTASSDGSSSTSTTSTGTASESQSASSKSEAGSVAYVGYSGVLLFSTAIALTQILI
ncbi:hypothetical protein B0O99DRAFT_688124 [Bisporella sp. PMI_857]|nr:hypothetical protein B0O99DRAFT_688124 [Bisporella sp. PMI_857]